MYSKNYKAKQTFYRWLNFFLPDYIELKGVSFPLLIVGTTWHFSNLQLFYQIIYTLIINFGRMIHLSPQDVFNGESLP